MRTWVLLFFCLLVLVAIANSKSNDNNDDTPKNKKGKNRKQEHGGGNVNPNEQRIKKLEQGSDSEQQGQERQEQTLKSKLKQKNNNQKQEKDCQDTCMKSDSKCKGKIITGNCPGNEVCCKTTKNKQNGIKRFCTPLDPCNRVIGECRKKKTGCAKGEKLYKSTKKVSYCSKKSCICCATPCAAKKTCTKEGGTCQSATASCDGKLKSKNAAGKKYCKGKKCACCIPKANTNPPTVAPTRSSTVAPTSTLTVTPTSTSTVTPTSTSSDAPTTNVSTFTTTSTDTTTTNVCNVTRAYCPDCGVANISVVDYLANKIVNGSAASVNEYPYQVAVLATIGTSQYLCGGSIIKKKWILTAAHCFFDKNGVAANQTDVKVRYGYIDINIATEVIAVGYIAHQNYTRSQVANDIALVELPSELDYTTNPSIHPICLAEDADIPIGGKTIVTGWGRTSYEGFPSNLLQEVTVNLITMEQCQIMQQAIGIPLPPDTNTVVCALAPYKGSCKGDSGGALIARVCPNRWVQVGIVSYALECARPDAPTVYTKVSAFRTWIDTNTGSSTVC